MFSEFFQFSFSGITLGAIYALVALGFTLIYNASHVINFAQGEFLMIGGMGTVVLMDAGAPIYLAIPGAIVMAGIAGALYVPQVGIINPGEFAPVNSIEIVVWAAVGGRGTLIGPVIGALLANFGKSTFTAIAPEFWLFVLGSLFVFVTLFLPRGIVGTIDHGWNAWRARRGDADREKGEAVDKTPVPAPGPAE